MLLRFLVCTICFIPLIILYAMIMHITFCFWIYWIYYADVLLVNFSPKMSSSSQNWRGEKALNKSLSTKKFRKLLNLAMCKSTLFSYKSFILFYSFIILFFMFLFLEMRNQAFSGENSLNHREKKELQFSKFLNIRFTDGKSGQKSMLWVKDKRSSYLGNVSVWS